MEYLCRLIAKSFCELLDKEVHSDIKMISRNKSLFNVLELDHTIFPSSKMYFSIQWWCGSESVNVKNIQTLLA